MLDPYGNMGWRANPETQKFRNVRGDINELGFDE
jgi:hypothetical protein